MNLKKAPEFITLALLVLLALFFHRGHLSDFPNYTHSWAQADQYALAIGFTQNRLDFFHPQTFVLNHQFPGNFKIPDSTSITAVDFPIHQYIPALLMYISNNNSPGFQRWYIFIYSIIGLLFLFKLSTAITKNKWISVFIVSFAATSPLFVYYQTGFFPTIPSIANVIIGLYFLVRFETTEKKSFYFLTLFFLTLAALSRTPFVIWLLALSGMEGINLIQQKKLPWYKVCGLGTAFLIICGYYLYNQHLTAIYGSMFLNHLMPANNIQQFNSLLKTVIQRWSTRYFSTPQLIVGAAILMVSVPFLIRRKETNSVNSFLLKLTGISFLGYVMYFIAMIRQFPDHDYYFLDTFFLPIILLLILIFSYIRFKKSIFNRVFGVLLALIFPFFLKAAKQDLNNRMKNNPNDIIKLSEWSYEGSERFLDKLGISPNTKILVLDANTPNTPLVQMNRKGYSNMATSPDDLQNMLSWNYDFITVANALIPEVIQAYPEFMHKACFIATNDRFTVFKPCENDKEQSPESFLKWTRQPAFFNETVSFDTVNSGAWKNTTQSDSHVWSGKYSGMVSPEMKYGITLCTSNSMLFESSNLAVKVQAMFFEEHSNPVCSLILSLKSGDETVYYTTVPLNKYLIEPNEWKKITIYAQVPVYQKENAELLLYVMNQGTIPLYYDDFNVTIYNTK